MKTKEEIYTKHFGVDNIEALKCEVCYCGDANVSKIWEGGLNEVIDNIANFMSLCQKCKMKYATKHYRIELQKLHNVTLKLRKNEV